MGVGPLSIQGIIDRIAAGAARCEDGARGLHKEPLKSQFQSLNGAIRTVGEAWSQSWLGYQATVYLRGFRPPRRGEHFDVTFGLEPGPFNKNTTEWIECRQDEVVDEILHRAGLGNTADIEAAAKQAGETFDQIRADLLPILDALLSVDDDPRLREIREEVVNLKRSLSQREFVEGQRPNQIMTTLDHRANRQALGQQPAPPHIAYEGWLLSQYSHMVKVEELGKIARQAEQYPTAKKQIGGRAMPKVTGTVFIGHGRSGAWKDLKSFLQDRLNLTPDEFNLQSVAGMPTTERLQEMLDSASFAFLVLTAEDEHVDGTQHARENVIHEAGLFQGKLGFKKAIVLLEDGCAEFSNIEGLGQIRFPHGNIGAKSEEIRRVLEREGII